MYQRMTWASLHWNTIDPDQQRELANAALTASDALLRTDEAVERVARAIYAHVNPPHAKAKGWDSVDGKWKHHYLQNARAAITALLGEGE